MHIAVFEVLQPIHDRAEERLGRRYAIGFEETRLTVQRSGPIRSPSVSVERFATHEDLLANVREKLKRRACNGYVLNWWSEGFPLLGWLRDRAYPTEFRAIVPSGIQLEFPLWDWSGTDP